MGVVVVNVDRLLFLQAHMEDTMVEFICDGCGKRQTAMVTERGDFFKPHAWYQRTDEDGTQVACSRECIEKVAQDTGKTNLVLPV